MRVFHADHQHVELPAAHRFPMRKYRDLRLALLERRVLEADEVREAPFASRDLIEAVHDAGYVKRVFDGSLDAAEVRRIGLPWSRALLRRTLASVGATLAATASALDGDGLSGTLAGGTHHAFRDGGAGYCVFNDLAIAATHALEQRGIARVLVFDVDVHQGDGTAALFADDPRVFTCSVHGARNFPLRKQPGDLDVALPDDTGDDAYLEAVEAALSQSLAHDPELVLVQAGVDALAADRLGRLAVSETGLLRRDTLVLERLVGAGVPTVLTLGGGYSEPIERSIDAHVNTWRAAKAAALRGGQARTGAAPGKS